jgi:hypothetical protein
MASLREIAFQFSGEAEPLLNTLRSIQAQIKRVPESKNVHIGAKVAEAMGELDRVQAKVEELDHAHASAEITADTKKLAVKLAEARLIIDSLPKEKVTTIRARLVVDKNVKRVESIIAGVVRDAERIGTRALADVGKSAESAVQPTFQFAGAFSKAQGVLTSIGPLVRGVGLAIIGAMIPAILAAIAAIGGFITAAAALGTALAAIGGPIIGILIGLFTRLAAIIKVRKEQTEANNVATGKGAQADQTAAANAEKLHDAHRSVADAVRGVTDATRNLADARKQARQNLSDARDTSAQDEANVLKATQDLRDATVQAYRDMQDAILGAKQAQLDYNDAVLAQQGARIDLEQAKLDLKNLGKQAGLTGAEIDAMTKKFTDVNFKPKDAGAFLGTLGIGGQDKIDAEQVALRLKEATNGVAEADLNEKKAKLDSNRAQQTANDYKTRGIQANDGYRSAVDALSQAQKTATKSQKVLNDLERQGIEGSPQVKAAIRARADAVRSEAEARHNLAVTHDEIAASGEAFRVTAAKAQKELQTLSSGEQQFLAFIGTIGRTLKNIVQPATDAIFGALADVGTRIAAGIGMAQDKLNGLGKAMADQVRQAGNLVLKPANIAAFGNFIDAAKAAMEPLGDIFGGLFQTLVNIANATLPLLLGQLKKLADFFKGTADATSDPGGLRKALEPMVKIFDTIISGAARLGAAIVDTFSGASGPINAFFGAIGKAFKSFDQFTKSAKGKKEVQGFFKDTLPFAKSFGALLGQIIRVLITSLRIILPILKPVVDTLVGFAEILELLLKGINFILGPFKTLIGVAIAFFLPMSKVTEGLKFLKIAIDAFPFALGLLIRAVLDFGAKFLAPFRNAFAALRALFSGTRFAGLMEGMLGALRGIGTTIIRVLTAPYRTAFRLIRGVFSGAIGPISSVAGKMVDLVGAIFGRFRRLASPVVRTFESLGSRLRSIFSGIGDTIGTIFRGITDVMRGAVNLIIDGLNSFIRVANKIPSITIRGHRLGLPHIDELPHLASGGVTSGATTALIGEAGQEAVIPLTQRVLSDLGKSIVQAMTVSSPLLTGAASGASRNHGIIIENVNLPPAPAAAIPDARYQAVQLARELTRRGGATT